MVGDVSVVDGRLDPSWQYSQIPAFSASDRAMIDVLTATTAGRLAVVELKADEDIHLPLQGLDYWSRVEWHHRAANSLASDISAVQSFSGKTTAVSGGARPPRPSNYGQLVALPFARDRMAICRD